MGRVSSSPSLWAPWILLCVVFRWVVASDSCSGDVTISSDTDRLAFLNCVVNNSLSYTGNIVFSSYLVTGPGPTAVLDISSLQTVYGSLEFVSVFAQDEKPLVINASSLQTVTSGLSFSNVGNLWWRDFVRSGDDSTTNYPVLGNSSEPAFLTFHKMTFSDDYDDFEISTDLPGFASPNISITFEETSLASISGSVYSPSVSEEPFVDLKIVDNDHLRSVMISGYTSANATITGNRGPLQLNLSTLTSSPQLSVSGVRTLNLNALSWVGNAEFSSNSFTDLNLPLLTAASENLVITDNVALSNMNLSSLSSVNHLSIIDNAVLSNVSLPKLGTTNSTDLRGPLDNINIPILVTPTLDIAIAPPGTYACSDLAGRQHKASTNCGRVANRTSSPTATANPSSGGGGLSTGAKIGIGVGVGVGGLLVILGAIIYCCFVHRKPARKDPVPPEYIREQKSSQSSIPAAVATDDSRVGTALSHYDHRSKTGLLAGQNSDNSRTREDDINEEMIATEESRFSHDLHHQDESEHEMDARSLQDIEISDDGHEDSRGSFDDIERMHARSQQI